MSWLPSSLVQALWELNVYIPRSQNRAWNKDACYVDENWVDGWTDEQVDGQMAEGRRTWQNKNTFLIKASIFSLLPS